WPVGHRPLKGGDYRIRVVLEKRTALRRHSGAARRNPGSSAPTLLEIPGYWCRFAFPSTATLWILGSAARPRNDDRYQHMRLPWLMGEIGGFDGAVIRRDSRTLSSPQSPGRLRMSASASPRRG